MKPPPPPTPPVRLWMAGGALLAVIILCAGLHRFMQEVVRRNVETFNTNVSLNRNPPRGGWLDTDLQVDKLKGVALMEQVYRDAALLPVYGSSELTQPQNNRADAFFSKERTGFGAFLLGNPGETCLIIATKLAAMGPEARGKKAVVFLSPGWFLVPELDHAGFGVNFSPLHGGSFAFGRTLSPDLRRDLARRLLDYPEIIGQNLLLDQALHAFAQGRSGTETLRTLTTPLGWLENRIQRVMDEGRLGLWWWRNERRGDGGPQGASEVPSGRVDWRQRGSQTDAAYTRQPTQTPYSTGPRTAYDDARRKLFFDPGHPAVPADENFARACLNSKEWIDYELLLRTAREVKIHLLVICQPLNAKFCQLQGLSAQSTHLFYDHLAQVTAPFKVRLQTFPDAEHDPHFFQDSVHPSAKAWLAYDEALDQFYHEPVPADGL